MNFVKVLAATMVIIIMMIYANITLINAGSSESNYIYAVKSSGIADVTVIVRNVSSFYDVYIHVDKGALNESFVAFDSKGNLLPLQIINSSLVDVIAGNSTDTVMLQYVALLGNSSGGVTSITISPGGNATVKLPKDSGLLYFSDEPRVQIVGSSITLYYSKAGTYEITFIPPIITATTTPLPTTTAAKTTSSPLTTISSATTAVTTATTVQSITSTPPISSATTKVTRTTSSTLPVSTTSTALTTVPITTSTSVISGSMTASPTSSPTPIGSLTSTTSVPKGISYTTSIAIASIIVAIIAIGLAAVALLRKRQKSMPSVPPVASIGSTELDDRDLSLLKLISEKETTISELAKRSGLSKSVVWRRVNKLSGLGLISKENVGLKTILRLTENGWKALKSGGSVQ